MSFLWLGILWECKTWCAHVILPSSHGTTHIYFLQPKYESMKSISLVRRIGSRPNLCSHASESINSAIQDWRCLHLRHHKCGYPTADLRILANKSLTVNRLAMFVLPSKQFLLQKARDGMVFAGINLVLLSWFSSLSGFPNWMSIAPNGSHWFQLAPINSSVSYIHWLICFRRMLSKGYFVDRNHPRHPPKPFNNNLLIVSLRQLALTRMEALSKRYCWQYIKV